MEPRRFCVCGELILPRAELGNGNPLGLGIAGPRGAGKTMMALAMIHQLRRQTITERAVGLRGLGETEARFGAMLKPFLEGQKPDATPPEVLGVDGVASSVGNNFCWELVLGAQRQRSAMLLAYHDLAGETWSQGVHTILPRLDRYLRLLVSLVLVVDGAAVAADLGLPARDDWDVARRQAAGASAADHQMLTTLVDRLGQRVAEVSLAVVVSKADLFWETSPWTELRLTPGRDPLGEEHQRLLKELLTRSNRRDLFLTSQPKFRKVRLFAVSSLGFRPQTGDVHDERLMRQIEPAGVTVPLSWLLEESWPALRSS
jgi:hypothetical protein